MNFIGGISQELGFSGKLSRASVATAKIPVKGFMLSQNQPILFQWRISEVPLIKA
jgi:hypothetical protein